MIFFTDIFEITKPTTDSVLLFSEISPDSPATGDFFYGDALEVVATVVWDTTIYFEDIDPTVSYTDSPIYADDLGWLPSLSDYGVFTDTAPTSEVLWGDSPTYLDNTEEWQPFHYDIQWASYYVDTEMVSPVWDLLYQDNTEVDFSPWHPVHPELSGYLPTALFSYRIFVDSYEAPIIDSFLIYREDTSVHPQWYSIFSDADEWVQIDYPSSLYQETFEWLPILTETSFFVDEFSYIRPVTVTSLVLADTMEWNTFLLGWDLLGTDNMEVDFPPYLHVPTENGYLPTDIWKPLFTDTYEVQSVVEWNGGPYYVDNFNVTPITFGNTVFYSEGYENIPLLQYGLTATYIFELVIWSDVTYSETWEWMSTLNYFDPFIEDFEWEPSASYTETPDLSEEFELNKVWECFLSDSFES